MRKEIIRWKPWHLETIKGIQYLCYPNREKAASIFQAGKAFSLVINEEVKACFGVYELWEGTWDCWVIVNPIDIRPWAKTFHSTIKDYLRRAFAELPINRMQSTVDIDLEVNRKWIERLGFKFEGILEEYISGRAFIMYAKLRGGPK